MLGWSMVGVVMVGVLLGLLPLASDLVARFVPIAWEKRAGETAPMARCMICWGTENAPRPRDGRPLKR